MSKSISIIHLSDIHIKENRNVVESRVAKIFEAIKNRLLNRERIFIVTTGDIAFSGKQSEYKRACNNLYNPLYKLIHDYTNTDIHLVFIPGNHDCEFARNAEKVRNAVLKDLRQNGFTDLDDEVISVCCAPQTNYVEFVHSIRLKNNGDLILDEPLLQISTFNVAGRIIKFSCYNTSWGSYLKEHIGNMGYPIEYMMAKIPKIESDLSISLLHHPFNWQTPENSKKFRQALALTSDIVISGHEHSADITIFQDFKEAYTAIHVESGALQDTDLPNSSEFNLIDVDLESMSICVRPFKYYNSANRVGYETNEDCDWKPILHFNKLKDSDFTLKNEFDRYLDDPGASFIHPNTDHLSLSDIYISPNLTDIETNKAKKRQLISFLSSSSVLELPSEIDNTKRCILLLGNEGCGKTAVLRHHFKQYYIQGRYPILINASTIESISKDKLFKFIEKEFKRQYHEADARFSEIDYRSVVILIDDFHKLPFKNGRESIIEILQGAYATIIITGNELMQYESYTKADSSTKEIFLDFEKYLIQEYGPTLRNQLVNKWYRVGKEYLPENERNDFFRLVDEAESYITEIIGKNLIPSYPIYILSILQALQTGVKDSSDANLYGYYYELLITRSLRKAVIDKDDTGFYISFSKEYCYFLFDSKIRFSPLSLHDFKNFIIKHGKNYNIHDINTAHVIETLVNASIIIISPDNFVTIAYKYIYYFFVAKYLSDNIEEDDIREQVELMAERVYREEYSNIILFLTHLSKSKFIIEKLIEKSKQIFADVELIQLNKDIEFINNLQASIPEKIIQEFRVEKSREENIISKEEHENEATQAEYAELVPIEEYDLREDLSTIDMLAYLTKAVRTINILGQITRKYWGEMKGENKFSLAEETFSLGLRTLKYYFGMLENSQQTLIQHVKSIIDRKHVKDEISKIEVEAITANFIFSLSSASSFGLIKRVVNSIGSEKLAKTFDDIVQKLPFNSVKIIHAAIKLDHFDSFPLRDIEELVKDNEKNPLAFVVLQNLVLDYLYMYDVSIERKQQIFSLLKIKIQNQRYIAATSEIKKS